MDRRKKYTPLATFVPPMSRPFQVARVAPAGATLTEVKLRGVVQTLASGATEATLKLGYIQGDQITFSARWQ